MNKQQGLVKMIILIIIAIAILSWFNVDIKEFFTSPQMQKNLGYVWSALKGLWGITIKCLIYLKSLVSGM